MIVQLNKNNFNKTKEKNLNLLDFSGNVWSCFSLRLYHVIGANGFNVSLRRLFEINNPFVKCLFFDEFCSLTSNDEARFRV